MDTYMKYKGANMWPTHPLLSKPWCFQWARNEKKIMWMFFKSSHFFTFLWLIPNLKISQLENCRTLLRLKIFQMLLVAHMKILYTIFLCAISLNFTLILFYCKYFHSIIILLQLIWRSSWRLIWLSIQWWK